MRCPKSRFPIRIIVFDELELIIFVSQGLTLSTASLVKFIYFRGALPAPEAEAENASNEVPPPPEVEPQVEDANWEPLTPVVPLRRSSEDANGEPLTPVVPLRRRSPRIAKLAPVNYKD